MSVNKVILVGNLGADPEVHQFSNGGSVANVSIATTERWTDKQTGERREATEWHRVVFNNRLAEIAQQYLRRGSQVYVEGSLRTRKWQDQNGQDRYSTEIRALNMQMLGGNPNNNQYNNQGMGGQAMGMGGNPAQNAGFNNPMHQGQNSFAQNSPADNPMGNPMNNQMNNSFANANPVAQPAPQQAQAPQPQGQQLQANPQSGVMSDAPADDDIPF